MKFETVIGLEVHVQINTATKLFCACSNDDFDLEPNTAICPVCMGFPGQLPVLNAKAVEKAVRTALALNCTIPTRCKFDRKNYFYPDLPKGYQISQFDKPLSENGSVAVRMNGHSLNVRIRRLHLEDDAGKLTHEGDASLCDYNRSGSPLMEIVTEPDLRTPQEAKSFAEELQRIVRTIDTSEADMYKGQMRFDASVSLRPEGETKLYPRTEIKNLNSFRALETALTHEIERQKQLWTEGRPQDREITVGWIADQNRLQFLRDKEGSDDYRYFPEPDLPPLTLERRFVKKLQDNLPALPSEKFQELTETLGLSAEDAQLLVSDRELLRYFEHVTTKVSPKDALRWIISEWGEIEKRIEQKIYDSHVSAEKIVELIQLINAGTISGKIAKEILSDVAHTGKHPEEIIEEKGLRQMSDTGKLESICQQVIAANPQSVTDFCAGKEKALGALVGQVMAQTKGQANPQLVNEILRRLVISPTNAEISRK